VVAAGRLPRIVAIKPRRGAAGDRANDRRPRRAPSAQVYGRAPPELPSFAANVAVSRAMHFDDGGILTTHLKFSIRDSYYFRVYDNPATDVVPELRQWDLDFKYQFGAQKVHVDFLIKNLTNTASVLSRYTDNFGVGAVSNFLRAAATVHPAVGSGFLTWFRGRLRE